MPRVIAAIIILQKTDKYNLVLYKGMFDLHDFP